MRRVIGLIVCGAIAQAADRPEPALSAAENAVVARQLATLKGPVDRHMAEGWTNAKKVAEFMCRPAALPILQKREKGVDRVFLGTDAPETLTLAGNRRLTGIGQYRAPKGWQDFTFTCDLNPDTGKVTAFQIVPAARP
ncbi:MAG TPA: hypothetical protein VK604_15405 [Bryobacteraceae bacterium]|nr:hypothetical protein [Bryobacteraceae bacterium]